MTPDNTQPQATTIPLARDNELRLAKIRRELETIYLHVHLARNEVTVAADAAKSVNQPQLENVLREAVAHRLFRQLEALTSVIERLGGRTELSEEQAPQSSGAVTV